MAIRTKLAVLLGSTLLASLSFAQDVTCPSIDSIKNTGFMGLTEAAPQMFAAFAFDTYDTDTNWGFAIGPIVSEDMDEANDIAEDTLADMTAPGVLHQYPNLTICTYDTGNPDIFAGAIKDGFKYPVRDLNQMIRSASRK